MEKIIATNNINQKKAGVAVLISDRADFKQKKVITYKERYDITIKGLSFPRRHNNPYLTCMCLTTGHQIT